MQILQALDALVLPEGYSTFHPACNWEHHAAAWKHLLLDQASTSACFLQAWRYKSAQVRKCPWSRHLNAEPFILLCGRQRKGSLKNEQEAKKKDSFEAVSCCAQDILCVIGGRKQGPCYGWEETASPERKRAQWQPREAGMQAARQGGTMPSSLWRWASVPRGQALSFPSTHPRCTVTSQAFRRKHL